MTSSAASSDDVPPAGFAQIPGTRISLRVPEGMQVDSSLPGLGRPGTRTSVVVLDQAQSEGDSPEAILDEIGDSFRDEERSARQGLTLGEPQRIEVAGHPGVIVTGTQTQGAELFNKVLVALAPPDSLVLLTGTAHVDDPLGLDQLRAVLTDARWIDERAPSGLGIDITAAAGYKPVPSSGALQFSLGGATGPDVPIFIAAPSQGDAPVASEQRRTAAEQRFAQLPGNPSSEMVTETSVAGLPGWEIVGQTPGEVVFTVMVFSTDGYVLLTGMAPKGQPDQLPAFREMVNSLRLT